MQERMVQDAVIRNFEVIGEAANRLSATAKSSASVPWGRIVAFRNRLIHGYWSVDLPLLWDVVVNEVPILRAEVVRLLGEPDGF